MQIVYIPGVWDLFHVGHLTILERAKALGDNLVVGVPSDDVVIEDKGKPPIIPLVDRLRIISSLSCVGMAVPYYKLEFITHLEMIQPDIFVVGEGWGGETRHADAERWLHQNRKRLVRLPRYQDESTTSIKDRIVRQESER